MSRTSPTELPSEEELLQILSKESQRMAVQYDYMDTHAGIYDAYTKLAARVGADVNWIEDFPTMSLSDVKTQADHATDVLADYILAHPSDYDDLFDALNVDDIPEPSDCIFVFGAKSDARIEKAVELYHKGLAPYLVVSGRGPHYGEQGSQAEAARMREYALAAGIPDQAIIVEDKSITLPDNVKRAVDLFEEMNWRPTRIISVSTTFVQRRTQLEWYKFMPWRVRIFTVSCDQERLRPSFCQMKWSLDEQGVRLLLNEYNKIIVEQAMDIYRRSLTKHT